MTDQQDSSQPFQLSRRTVLQGAALVTLAFRVPVAAQEASPTPEDPLPSWNDGAVKTAILDFIARTTDPSSSEWVAPADRLAVFDLDGTMWVERPTYVDLLFAEDQARLQLEEDPSLASQEPWQTIVDLDEDSKYKLTEEETNAIVVNTFVNMKPETYRELAVTWLNAAVNTTLRRRHVHNTYLPMTELRELLRHNEFTLAMASAGDIEFLRAHCEPVFGISRNLTIGTTVQTKVVTNGDQTDLVRTETSDLGVWGDGKPISIDIHIGRRPILAFGNADGDLQMLNYTLSTPGPSAAFLVHHDDAEREFAYDVDVNLKTPLKDLQQMGITVISMKDDFRTVFPSGPGPNIAGT